MDHALEFSDDSQDGVASLVGLVLVSCDGDDALLLCFLPWKLNLNIKVVSDLRNDSSSSSNDLGMVFRVYLNSNLERLALFILFLLLKFLHFLCKTSLGRLDIRRNSTDEDDVTLCILGGDTNVDVKSVHHLTDTSSLLSNDIPVKLEGNADLSRDGDQLQESLAGTLAVVLLAGDLDDVGVGGSSLSVILFLSSILNCFVRELNLDIEVCGDLLDL